MQSERYSRIHFSNRWCEEVFTFRSFYLEDRHDFSRCWWTISSNSILPLQIPPIFIYSTTIYWEIKKVKIRHPIVEYICSSHLYYFCPKFPIFIIGPEKSSSHFYLNPSFSIVEYICRSLRLFLSKVSNIYHLSTRLSTYNPPSRKIVVSFLLESYHFNYITHCTLIAWKLFFPKISDIYLSLVTHSYSNRYDFPFVQNFIFSFLPFSLHTSVQVDR